MPGLELVSRLYLRHRLVDGVATAQWFGRSCHMPAAWMFCVSVARPMQDQLRPGVLQVMGLTMTEGLVRQLCLSVQGGMSNKRILEEA